MQSIWRVASTLSRECMTGQETQFESASPSRRDHRCDIDCARTTFDVVRRCARRPLPVDLRGFTLIEVLVTVLIISIIVTAALVVLSSARHTANQTACAARLRNVGVGVTSYAIDHYGSLPKQYRKSPPAFDSFWMRSPDGDLVNLGLVTSYVGAPQAFYCVTQTAATSPRIAYNTAQNPWNVKNALSAFTPALNSSFTVRPGNGARWSVNNHNNKVIYTDFIGVRHFSDSARFPGGLQAPHDLKGANRLVGDGSVQWVESEQVHKVHPILNVVATDKLVKDYYKLLDVLP